MKKWELSVLSFFFLIQLFHPEVHGSVTLLLERPGPTKNTSELVKGVYEASKKENERVTAPKIILTKDDNVREAWRTDKGELVHLQYLKTNPTYNAGKNSLSNVKVDSIGTNSVMVRDTPAVGDTPSATNAFHLTQRTKRTFWPFTGLFGSDYDYYGPPPPPPPFGMFGGPFSPGFGGFGGLGGGFGYPYAGRGSMFAPPPPLLGLDFSLGI